MAFASVNGAKLAYQQLGESGPHLLLVHGLATNRAFWFPHATALSNQFRVTLFDLRGHGYSERTASGYDVSTLARDIVGLMDELKIERAALAGHSYGGAAALEAAGLAPQRISHLALFDVRVTVLQPAMRLHDMPYLSDFEREIAGSAGVDWENETQVGFKFLEAAARRRVSGAETQARDDFTPFGEGRGALRAAKAWVDLLEQTSANTDLHVAGMDAERIAALPMPLLFMYAQRSRCLPSGHALHALLPRARYEEVPDAGHFFPMSHARLVVDMLRHFLL
ncbi:MAG TPA: alpha/beta hydrolase [Nevskiaceae bacterium]|nr:alpha/beta hydrolase [Nevskiaceae bacterium]